MAFSEQAALNAANVDLPGISNLSELAAELVSARFLTCQFDGDDHLTLVNARSIDYIEPVPAHLSAVAH